MEPLVVDAIAIEERDLPDTVADWAGLWIEDVVYAAEYWLVAGAQAALSVFAWAKESPAAIAAAIGLAASAAVALGVHDSVAKARSMTAWLDLESLANGAKSYQERVGQFPVRLEQLVPNQVRALSVDPWGRNYASFRGPGGFAIVSAGPDGQLGTDDDLVQVVSIQGQKP